jgi:hypothetical protein
VRSSQHICLDRLRHAVEDESHPHRGDEEADDAGCRVDAARADAAAAPADGMNSEKPMRIRMMPPTIRTMLSVTFGGFRGGFGGFHGGYGGSAVFTTALSPAASALVTEAMPTAAPTPALAAAAGAA